MKHNTNEWLQAGSEEYPISNNDFHDLLSDAVASDVTEADLADFDESEFDTNGIDIPKDLSDPMYLLTLLPEATDDASRSHICVEADLFSSAGPTISNFNTSTSTTKKQRFQSLVPLVVRAYADIRNGCSTDFVVLEPEMNLLFLQRCWELGAAASPDDLNWTLMNARKDGKMGDLPKATPFSISKAELDTYSFAAEVALRFVQDRVLRDEQKEISLDKLLCNPRLATEYDELASRVVPGLTSLQYRWAAMALRKARRLPKGPIDLSLFQDAGLLEDVKPSTLPMRRGVYWVEIGDCSTFIGVADNLRLQLDAFVGRLGKHVVPEWFSDRPLGKPKVRIANAGSFVADDASMLRSSVIRVNGSRLNYRDEGLFNAGGSKRRAG